MSDMRHAAHDGGSVDPAGSHAAAPSGIGVRIRAHREALGMSQDELAQACFVSRPTVSSWERGRTQPRAEDLGLLAAAFDISADELIAGPEGALPRVSADRRELAVLFWAWWIAIALALVCVRAWDASGGGLASWQFAAMVAALIAMFAPMVRAGVIARRHGLRSIAELVSYAQGAVRPDDLSGRPAWVRWAKCHAMTAGVVLAAIQYLLISGFIEGVLPFAAFVPLIAVSVAADLAVLYAVVR